MKNKRLKYRQTASTDANSRSDRFARHAGVTMIELIVSATVLVAVMSFVTTLLHRADGLWKDCGHHRAAMCELSNQMEQLTLLPPDELSGAVASLKPSHSVALTLHDPILTGQMITDDLGPRLVLRIDWTRRYPGRPIEMVAWLREPPIEDSEVPQ